MGVGLPLRLHHWAASKILPLVSGSDQKEHFFFILTTMRHLINCLIVVYPVSPKYKVGMQRFSYLVVPPPDTARTIIAIMCYPNTATY